MDPADTLSKSWLLLSSSEGSHSPESLCDAFEEVDFYSNPESANDEIGNASYEVIEGLLDENCIKEAIINEERVVVEPERQPEEQPVAVLISRQNEAKRQEQNNFIQETAANLQNSSEKELEIQNFENLLKKFDKWYLDKREKKYIQLKGMRPPETRPEDIPSFKFLVQNSSMNAFIFPFSDVYVNIVASKQSHKHRVQGLFAEFLKEVEPQGITQEYDFKGKKNNRKLIFKFNNSNTKFHISVGLDFRVRMNHFIKLCTNIDRRFLTIGSFLSLWAHKRGILNENYLNPYGLHFMIIYFLMNRSPSILPKFAEEELENMNFSKKLFSSSQVHKPIGLGVAQEGARSSSHTIEDDGNANNGDSSQETLIELITQFFKIFAHEVPKLRKSLSVRKGMPIKGSRQVIGYSIEDPFNPQYDLCKHLNDVRCKGFQTVQKEFDRAYRLIVQGKLDDLLQEAK